MLPRDIEFKIVTTIRLVGNKEHQREEGNVIGRQN